MVLITIAIRDGGNSVDVSGFFVHSYLSDAVGRSTANSKTGKSSGSNYSIQEFVLQDVDGYQPLALHYSVSGVAVENFSIPAIPGPRSELSADVSGTGDSAGNLLILQGTTPRSRPDNRGCAWQPWRPAGMTCFNLLLNLQVT